MDDQELQEEVGNEIKRRSNALGFSAETLAKLASVSPSTVNRWFRGESLEPFHKLHRLAKALETSIDELFDTGLGEIDSKLGFKYRVAARVKTGVPIPIEAGIKAFKAIIELQASKDKSEQLEAVTPQLLKHDKFEHVRSLDELRRVLELALRAGAITISDVERDTEEEEKLTKRLGLKQCLVAKVDLPKRDRVIDQTIRREIVATLVARTQLLSSGSERRICLTGGPNIARLIEAIPPNSLSGITWIPLLEARSLVKDIPTSSNALAARAAYNHPDTSHYKMPYLTPDLRDFQSALGNPEYAPLVEEAVAIFREARLARLTFVALGERYYDEKYLNDISSLGIVENALYLETLPADVRDSCVGTVLLHLVDKDGNRIGDSTHTEMIAKHSFGLSLEDLRELASKPDSLVWSLVDGLPLAPVNLAAVRGGYINAIAVDKVTAQELRRLTPIPRR